jgi:hypothetical protein
MAAVRPSRGNHPNSPRAAPIAKAGPEVVRIHVPMLIGEVGLNTRSMFRKRSGRPRSAISSAGLTATAPVAISHARRASASLPATSAATASGADAPARPPLNRYQGISHVHVGSLMIGRP